MTFRIARLLASSVVVLTTTTGCLPTTSPTGTPSPHPSFTNADQAFAAAQKTYRAYVDAVNQVDLSDPKTFEAVYAWTTGEALAGAKKSFTKMHADGWVVNGPTIARLVSPLGPARWRTSTIDVAVCLDIRDVTLVDRQGESVVEPDRRDIQSMKVTMARAQSPHGWLISAIDGREGDPACS